MGASDILKGSTVDLDSARVDRDSRVNPPDYAPGQGDSFMDDNDDFFSDSVGSSNDGGGLGDIGSSPSLTGSFNTQMGLGGDSFGGLGGNGMNGMNGGQQQQTSEEDKFFSALGKGFKGFMELVKDFSQSLGQLTPRFWTYWGRNVIYSGIGCAFFGIIIALFSKSGLGLDILIGSILTTAIGVLVLMFFRDKAVNFSSMFKDDVQETVQPPEQDFSQDFGDNNDDFLQDDDFNDDFNMDDFSNDDEYEDDDFSADDLNFGSDDEEDFLSALDTMSEEEKSGMSADDAINELQVIDKGMYTRQYLYDTVLKVLDNITPSFNTIKEIDEDSDTFIAWEEYLREAAEVSGVKEDDLPTLQRLEENLFTVKLTCTRGKSFKADVIANELSNIFAYVSGDGEKNESVFANADTFGTKCILTVFTGQSALISLKDMYKFCEDFVLDSKNVIPIVLGIDQRGKVIIVDFKKLESCIVAGMPRSGKSWLVQAILFQMCALLSPRDLNIYVLDPKAGTSDYMQFKLPHVKRFAAQYKDENGMVKNPESDSIMEVLRHIVNVEAPRRKKMLGDSGCVNIWDFKEKYPDIDIPLLYIVIDEMVTLSKMEKEDEKEYQSYLDQIVTQFPNLGIRGLFIPHEVKNQIISKTAYDAVKYRISVKGSPSHIEASTGTKPRDFKYKLCNTGDMAVNIPEISEATIFVHGVALSASNERNNELFDYLRRVWSKLEPESVKGSVAEGVESAKEMEKLLEESKNENLDDLSLFEDDNVSEIVSPDSSDFSDELNLLEDFE